MMVTTPEPPEEAPLAPTTPTVTRLPENSPPGSPPPTVGSGRPLPGVSCLRGACRKTAAGPPPLDLVQRDAKVGEEERGHGRQVAVQGGRVAGVQVACWEVARGRLGDEQLHVGQRRLCPVGGRLQEESGGGEAGAVGGPQAAELPGEGHAGRSLERNRDPVREGRSRARLQGRLSPTGGLFPHPGAPTCFCLLSPLASWAIGRGSPLVLQSYAFHRVSASVPWLAVAPWHLPLTGEWKEESLGFPQGALVRV